MKRNVQSVLDTARGLAQDSGLTYQEIGIRMGYPPESARQSVSQFLNGKNPTLAMILRFAEALGIEPKELFE